MGSSHRSCSPAEVGKGPGRAEAAPPPAAVSSAARGRSRAGRRGPAAERRRGTFRAGRRWGPAGSARRERTPAASPASAAVRNAGGPAAGAAAAPTTVHTAEEAAWRNLEPGASAARTVVAQVAADADADVAAAAAAAAAALGSSSGCAGGKRGLLPGSECRGLAEGGLVQELWVEEGSGAAVAAGRGPTAG